MQVLKWAGRIAVGIVLAAGLSGTANALIIKTFGSIMVTPGSPFSDTFGRGGITGAFTDSYTFGLTPAGASSDTTVTISSGISGFLLDLFPRTDAGTAATDPVPSANPTTGGSLGSVAGAGSFSVILGPGEYVLVATGTASPSSYAGTLDLTAIPLPPAMLLFGSALVGLIGVGRIRRRKTAAARLPEAA